MTEPNTTTITSATPPTRPRRWPLLAAGLIVAAAIGGGLAWWQVARVRAARDEAFRSEAAAALAARRPDDVRSVVGRWIAADRRSAAARYFLARAELAADRPDVAMKTTFQAGALGYDRPPLMALRAAIMAKTGALPDQDENLLRRAMDQPGSPQPEVAEALARRYLNTFRLDLAAQVLDRWMKLAPEDPKPYLWRTEIDLRSDADHAVLIRSYRAALQRDPNLDEARLGLAQRLALAHRYDEAEVEYAKYLARRPDDAQGYIFAGRAAMEEGEIDRAADLYRKAIERAPADPEALREMAAIDLRRNAIDDAIARARAAIAADPYDPEPYYVLARALKIQGDDPGSAEASRTAQRLRDEHAAMSDIRAALIQKPGNLELRREAAKWLLEHGRAAEGLEWAELVLRDAPDHADTLQLLADHYDRQGDPGRANYYRARLPRAPAPPTTEPGEAR